MHHHSIIWQVSDGARYVHIEIDLSSSYFILNNNWADLLC